MEGSRESFPHSEQRDQTNLFKTGYQTPWLDFARSVLNTRKVPPYLDSPTRTKTLALKGVHVLVGGGLSNWKEQYLESP